jgi:hypothetical protein
VAKGQRTISDSELFYFIRERGGGGWWKQQNGVTAVSLSVQEVNGNLPTHKLVTNQVIDLFS